MNKNLLTVEEVKKIAKLAKLSLSEEKVKKFQEQLSEVLNYVEILKEIKTEQIEPTNQVTGLENVTREDIVKKSLTQEDALSGAKKTEKEMFLTDAVFQDRNVT